MADQETIKIEYVEFTSPRLEETQEFFTSAFGWTFIDYGPDYRDIQGAGTGGGIERGETTAPLIVLRHDDLEAARDRVVTAGGDLTRDIYAFPGGRRFEFVEPGGTKMAVWSET